MSLIKFVKRSVLLYLTLLFLTTSCSYNNKKENSSSLDTNIDYTKIDLYPVLPECKNISKKLQKACFYNAISKRIQANLNIKKIKYDTAIKDTVTVFFVIDSTGNNRIKAIEHSTLYPKKDSVNYFIYQSFKSLPKMKPAVKMGILVNAQFNIHIVINSNEL